MNERPRQRKEGDRIPLERQQRVAPNRAAAAVRHEGAEQHLGAQLDDFRAPSVDDAEHQTLAVTIRRDDRLTAEEQRGGGPREPRKEQSSRERLIHQPDERFDGDDQVAPPSPLGPICP